MSKPIDKAPHPNAFISHDVPCHRCAYNLRGLPREGRCPECGAPVRVSLQGDLLRFADPRWLGTLSRGAKIPGYVLIAFTVSFLLGQSASLLLRSLGGFSAHYWLIDLCLMALFVLAWIVLLCGLWLVSTPNEATLAKENWRSPRRVVRATVPVAMAGLLAAAASFASGSRSLLWLPIVLTISPVGFVSVLGAWALSRYIQQLADRVSDGFTRGKARSYFRGYAASWLAFGAGGVTAGLIATPAGYLAMSIGGVGLLGFGVLCLFLPSYIAGELARELEKANREWAEADKAADGTHASGVQSPR